MPSLVLRDWSADFACARFYQRTPIIEALYTIWLLPLFDLCRWPHDFVINILFREIYCAQNGTFITLRRTDL